mgnify:CR=1 FL=1
MQIRLRPEDGGEILCDGCGAPIEDPGWGLVALVPAEGGYRLGGAYHKLTCDPGSQAVPMWEELTTCLALPGVEVRVEGGAGGWGRSLHPMSQGPAPSG